MASSALSTLRRAMLYVPASTHKMLRKSLALTVDNITYDLEDSVTPSEKDRARNSLREHLALHSSQAFPNIGEIAVRINAVSTPHALTDLTQLATVPMVDTIVVPKVNSASDLTFVTDALRHLAPDRQIPSRSPPRPPIKILALIESAKAITNLRDICSASPHLAGLIFAAEDFSLDLSLTRTPSLTEFLYARSAIVTAARAAELESAIDLVTTIVKSDSGTRLREECENGRGLGFNGKQIIHPDQIEPVQRLFSPSEQEVEWAVRVTIADEKAAAAGRGAWTLDGKMIDAPVAGKARELVARAERCGLDVEGVKERWRNQEPE